MDALLSDLRVQSAVVPFVAAALLTGVLRYAGGGRGAAFAALALVGGFLVAYELVLGLPGWPARGAAQKIAYIAGAGALLGLLIDLVRLPPMPARAVIVVGAAAAAVWLMGARFAVDDVSSWLWPGLVIVLVWAAVLGHLDARRGEPLAVPSLLIVAAVGASLVALYGRSGSAAQLAGAVGAAAAGYAVWNWPVARMDVGRAAVLGGGALVLAFLTQLALFTQAESWALIALLLVFAADRPAAGAVRRLIPASGALGKAINPIVHAALVAVPAAAAVVIAYLVAEPGSAF